jgi:glycosyltransferase involved in cell wall biosynthesis
MSGETQESIGWLPASEFILYVGRFHARKNLVRLLQAFARLKQRSESPVKLVLPGMDMYHRRDVLSAIASLRLERDVVCPGRVSDRTLDMLYAKASVFAFPSLHEGFGLPPLEAMARGLPVMACNVSAMPEVLGDAAVLVDPYDVDAMADGLERLLWDSVLRRTLIERGKAWCKRYSWDTTARKTLSVYEDVFKGGA